MTYPKPIAATLVAVSMALALPVSQAAAPVASFARINGHALVSKGGQYVEAKEGMSLAEGDRLMVMEGGSATIVFADDCRYQMEDNEVLTIGATSTCSGGGVQKLTLAQSGAAMGAAAIPPAAIAAGVVVVVAGVAVAASNDDNGNPLSP